MDVKGEGPPLVLVHGVATSRSIWRHVVPGLAEQHLVATPDMPGFGDSPPIGRGFVLEDVADELAEALGGLPGPVDLLGNSLGGAVAIVLAERRPDLLRRLILAAPAGLAPHRAPIPAIAGRVSATVVAARRRVAPRLVGNASARRVLLYGLLDRPRGRLRRGGARHHRRPRAGRSGSGPRSPPWRRPTSGRAWRS